MQRTRPLFLGSLRGRYQIADVLIEETQFALQTFDDAGRLDGGHEGICYWAGREESHFISLEKVLVPIAYHERFGVFVSAEEFGEVARLSRAMGLGVLAQVHSHPGRDTRHSDGDDKLVVMPFENMLSLVAPHYGRTLTSITDFSIHQFQNHRWVLCDSTSISIGFKTVNLYDK